jgi:hypothetical protein
MESHLQRLGTPDPVCCICGYSVPEGLTKTKRELVEQHHLMGRHEGPWVYLCRNHHAELTDVQRDHDPRLLRADRDDKTRLAAFLRGLADFFELLARALRLWAHEILGWRIDPAADG